MAYNEGVSYLRKAAKGIGWVGVLRGSTRVIALVKNLVLARVLLLAPVEFGLYGIAALVLALTEILTETGVNVVLIQEKKKIDDYLDTAWIVSILRGLVIALIILSGAGLVAKFFKAPGAVEVVVMISLVPLLRGFINPAVVKLEKELRFRTDCKYRMVIFGVDAIVAVVATVITGRAIGLVIGNIAGVVVEVAWSFWIVEVRPKLSFNWERARIIIGRGKWVTGAGIFRYLFQQGDDVVVGRILGAGPLGLYQMAYRIATLPITEVAEVVAKVTFPVYVKIGGDKRRLRRAYRQTTMAVGVAAVGMGMIILIFAKEIVLSLLGESWLGAVTALRVVTVYAVLRAIMEPGITILLATRRQEWVMTIRFAGILGMGLTIFPLVKKFGIAGAGMATVAGIFFCIPMVWYRVRQIFREG